MNVAYPLIVIGFIAVGIGAGGLYGYGPLATQSVVYLGNVYSGSYTMNGQTVNFHCVSQSQALSYLENYPPGNSFPDSSCGNLVAVASTNGSVTTSTTYCQTSICSTQTTTTTTTTSSTTTSPQPNPWTNYGVIAFGMVLIVVGAIKKVED